MKWRKFVLFEIVAVAFSVGLYFVLILGFGIKPPAAAAIAAFAAAVVVAAAFAAFVTAAIALTALTALALVAVAAAEDEKLKYSWTLFSLSVEAGSIFGALVVDALVVDGTFGIIIAAVGVALLTGLYFFLPPRFYLKAERKAGQVARAR